MRAQERLDEAAVALIPHLTQQGRATLLRGWLELAKGADKETPPPNYDRAWESLRAIIRRG